jgi:hypothetical protein
MLYTVAMTTGFRVSELAALTTASFDLDGLPPTVTIGATHTKNKRTVTQPLPDDIREPLRAYLAQRPAGATVWPGTWGEKAARMIRRDEAAAGIAYGVTVADGTVRYADFHALRHTYITLLGRSGVSAKEAQALARHSDVNLTLARYTHAALGELGAAVNRLPALSETPRPTVQITVEALAILGLVVKGAILTPGGASAALVAPLVAPRTDAPGDGSGRAGTKGHRRPGQAAKPLALVG